MTNPNSYVEWLALSDDERRHVHFELWNVYERDGIGFAFAAAGRLAISSPTKILDVRIETYHGGEYLIGAFVNDVAIDTLPPPLEQSFEGFRVAYRPLSMLQF
jgi:hypothetical protein